jgi:plasmid stabilization system protein ParE
MQTPSSVRSAAHMAEYRLSSAAERDLEGIWKYTRREWGLDQAERYTDLLTAAFQVLAESRGRHMPVTTFVRDTADVILSGI